MADYQDKLGALAQAGNKLAGELSRLGQLYKNDYGQSMGRLGQQLIETDNLRNQLANNLNSKFTGPMSKSLASEKSKFAQNEKKVKTTIATYEGELQKMIQTLAKEQVAGTNRILENVAAITKKVQEFDAVNVEMLRDLQQSQQKQFIEWSEKWHSGMEAQLQFHEQMEKKLEKIAPLWHPEVADGSKTAADVSSADEPAPAAASSSSDKPKAAAPAPAPKDKKSKKDKKEKSASRPPPALLPHDSHCARAHTE